LNCAKRERNEKEDEQNGKALQGLCCCGGKYQVQKFKQNYFKFEKKKEKRKECDVRKRN
jgi:hypothetical protein